MIERVLYSLLGAVIALKFAGVITWSWWLILLPFWALPALFGLVVLGVFAYAIWEA